MKKRICVIVLAGVCLLFLAFFGWKRQARQGLLDLLQDRYGESFAMVSCSFTYFPEKRVSTVCRSDKDSDVLFTADIRDGVLTDTYVSASVCRSVERDMESVFGDADCVTVRVVPVSRSIDSVDTSMSMQEFLLQKPSDRFAVYFCVSDVLSASELREKLSGLQGSLSGMSGNLLVYPMPQGRVEKVSCYFQETLDPDLEFEELTDDVNGIVIPFMNGVLDLDSFVF